MSAARLRFPARQLVGFTRYDTRGWGTDQARTKATGRWKFDLHPGNKTYYLDAGAASDSNDGLSPGSSGAKKTWPGIMAALASSYQPGDRIKIAGTQGRAYADPGATSGIGNITFKRGLNPQYPFVIQSYDPADPFNEDKAGWLTGSDRPVIQLQVAGDSSFNKTNDNGQDDFFVMQGLEFDGLGLSSNGLSIIGRHDWFGLQNMLFKDAGIGINNADTPYGYSQVVGVSMCSFLGPWAAATGNASGMFVYGTVGLWIQDSAYLHCGWKLGASRVRNLGAYPATTQGNSDWYAAGGAAVFGHGNYVSAHTLRTRMDRNFYWNNAADGFNARGSADCTQIVSMREPIAMNMGGFSGSPWEAAFGVSVHVDDYVIAGGTDIDTTVNPRGYGITSTNTLADSYIRNLIMTDNPKKGSGNYYADSYRNTVLMPTQSYRLQTVRGWNYADQLLVQSPNAFIHLQDVIADIAASGTTGASTAASAGTFPNAKTMAQMIALMGYGSENSMMDAIADHPELPWAQAIHGIAMPAFGLTPQFPVAAPPSLSGLPAPRTRLW